MYQSARKITRTLQIAFPRFFQAATNERLFNKDKLGRGQLGSLEDANYEFGDWSPMVGKEQGDVKILGDLVERGRAGRKSDDVSNIQYFPLDRMIEIKQAPSRQERTAEDRTDSTDGKRNARDCMIA